MLSQEYKKRTVQAINETVTLLMKEKSYRKDLQKKERIISYENHLVKLYAMIDG